ncbi:signal recognition particle protein [Moniliophthora roreri MCA 2997]|uniref:Signal recognition particle protein n=1 Tax=Moniliophthora roreri (strain MCA 2997) TaxID=1381753 RepID=V2XUR7_MONRO|nr:signal recognition particle protein [Moniliophthora roreri MCA 2997]
MSRRAAIVEEFDDDTDLPLPQKPLPNTGTQGPLLQEIDSDDDDFPPPLAGPASPPSSRSQFRPSDSDQMNLKNSVTDITPYKSWTCIYPIYIDAKRPYGTGQRRVERGKGIWWPLSKDIAEAANRLGLGTLHEVHKTHPRDWENPGRVRVQWKKDGRLMNPVIKTKKQLLEMICMMIQRNKPENIPKPPYNLSSSNSTASITIANSGTTSSESAAPTTPSSHKGKAPATHKSKAPLGSAPAPAPQRKQGGRRLPVPPEPHPPLASRVSPYSPALSSGVLIETVKAGMNATEGGAGAPGAGSGPMGNQKGKRKIIRVKG